MPQFCAKLVRRDRVAIIGQGYEFVILYAVPAEVETFINRYELELHNLQKNKHKQHQATHFQAMAKLAEVAYRRCSLAKEQTMIPFIF